MTPSERRLRLWLLRHDAAIFRYPQAQQWELDIAARLEAEAEKLEREQEKETVQ